MNDESQAMADAKELSRWFPKIRNSSDFVRTVFVFIIPAFIFCIIGNKLFGEIGAIFGAIVGLLTAFYFSSPRLVGTRAIERALKKKM